MATFKFSDTVRNGMLDTIESSIGTDAILKIRDGSPPANCAAADSGNVLATLTLPTDWMNAASGGSKTKLGTWEDTSADATGTAGHFRIYESTGTTCHIQGTVTVTGGGGNLQVSDVNFTVGQDFQITTFTITAGNG